MKHITLTWLSIIFQGLGFLATALGAMACAASVPETYDLVKAMWDQGGMGLTGAFWACMGLVSPLLAGLVLLAFGGLLRVAKGHGDWLEEA